MWGEHCRFTQKHKKIKLPDPKWVKSDLFLLQLANIWLGFWISLFFSVYMKQTVLGKENNGLLPVSKSPVVDKSAIQSHRHYLGAIRNLSGAG